MKREITQERFDELVNMVEKRAKDPVCCFAGWCLTVFEGIFYTDTNQIQWVYIGSKNHPYRIAWADNLTGITDSFGGYSSQEGTAKMSIETMLRFCDVTMTPAQTPDQIKAASIRKKMEALAEELKELEGE